MGEERYGLTTTYETIRLKTDLQKADNTLSYISYTRMAHDTTSREEANSKDTIITVLKKPVIMLSWSLRSKTCVNRKQIPLLYHSDPLCPE